MKKLSARIAAFALSLVVALGSVCYNPPKAEAVVVESAAAMAGAFTYLSATGFEFAGDGTAYGAMADAFQMMFTDLTEEYDAYVNEVSGYPEVVAPTLQETILGGMTLLENGFVEFSAVAANALGRFEDWLIDKLGLVAGTTCEIDLSHLATSSGLQIVVSPYSVYNNGFTLTEWIDQGYNVFEIDVEYELVTGRVLRIETDSQYTYWRLYENGMKLLEWQFSGVATWLSLAYCRSTHDRYGVILWDSNGLGICKVQSYSDLELWNCNSAGSLGIGVVADYEAAPTVEEQYAMVVNPGLTYADEQSFIDAVMGSALAGTLAPAYTIESATTGDVINPDVGTDTEDQANILSWLKHIVQDVRALPQAISDKFAAFPQAIANAIQGVFVPDAALTTEITDTFSEKFAFVPQLHRLGTDLLNLGPDSGPPVIYIHLEDAEGTIDYGGTVKALDMSWYERYKEDVDRIISGFLWLGFLWLCFMRASDIINGAGMVYAAGQPTIYTPDSSHDAPRLESPRWRRRG